MMSRQIAMFAFLSLALSLTCGCAAAQSATDSGQRAASESRLAPRAEQRQKRVRQQAPAAWTTEQETTPIADVMDAVSRKLGTRFLLDYRVPRDIVVGPAGYSDMDYEAFLTVLGNNGLAAVGTGDYVTVLPQAKVRQYDTPVVPPGGSAPAGSWVTRVFVIEHIPAPQLVPILRPMMPASGHLSAQADSNSLLVVDRFGNTERLREVIEMLDVPAEPR